MTSLSILSTTNPAVSGVVYTFQPDSGSADSNIQNDPKPWLIRVWANTGICVRTDGQDATQGDFPIAAGLHGELIVLPPGGSVSVIKQAGQVDGVAWFSHVKRV